MYLWWQTMSSLGCNKVAKGSTMQELCKCSWEVPSFIPALPCITVVLKSCGMISPPNHNPWMSILIITYLSECLLLAWIMKLYLHGTYAPNRFALWDGSHITNIFYPFQNIFIKFVKWSLKFLYAIWPFFLTFEIYSHVHSSHIISPWPCHNIHAHK